MSFSSDVKEELSTRIDMARHCQIAEFAAIMGMSGRIRRASGKRMQMFQSLVPSLWVSFTFCSDLSVAQPVPPGKDRSHVFYAMRDDLKKDANFLLILPRESGIIKVVQTDAPVCRNGRRGGLKIRFAVSCAHLKFQRSSEGF